MGGEGEVVEVDGTYVGTKKGVKKGRAFHHKNTVLSLVERAAPSSPSISTAPTSTPSVASWRTTSLGNPLDIDSAFRDYLLPSRERAVVDNLVVLKLTGADVRNGQI